MEDQFVTVKHKVTDEDINDIMCTALEGGINCWCSKAEVIDGDYKGAEYASDSLSKGAKLLLHDCEDDHIGDEEKFTLTKEKFMKGFQLYLTNGVEKGRTVYTDPGDIDACEADCIIQFAVFGEIVYG